MLSQLVRWILDTWRTNPDDKVICALKKFSVSNGLDTTENDMLWEDSDKEARGSSHSDCVRCSLSLQKKKKLFQIHLLIGKNGAMYTTELLPPNMAMCTTTCSAT